MSITAAMVKELRGRTGSGMMECKKALVEANGDLEVAIENMRKSGLAKADKKSGRTAAEGMIGVKVSDDAKTAVMIDVNCETDFVAKGEDFVSFVNAIVATLLSHDVASVEELAGISLPSGETVEDTRRALIAKLGENIAIRRLEKYIAEGSVACYLHGNKIGVIVELAKPDDALGKDIAMHVAASNPPFLNEEQVAPEAIQKEKDIFSAQALASGKPANIVEKMISGRIKKFLGEVTLLGQPFIKDDKISVAQLLNSKDNTVVRFTRFEVGEGIEKKEENFAEEVMAQVRG